MVSFDYTIKEPMGLHARPAGILVKKLKSLPCDVSVICGERTADAKKIFSIMGLAVKCGETVTVKIEGEDEKAVRDEVLAFFEQNF
ncbi:HPr family phosphocarrier protein [Oscillospiraceae bacterium PP1C4]